MSDGLLRTRIATALADIECEDRCGTTFRQLVSRHWWRDEVDQ